MLAAFSLMQPDLPSGSSPQHHVHSSPVMDEKPSFTPSQSSQTLLLQSRPVTVEVAQGPDNRARRDVPSVKTPAVVSRVNRIIAAKAKLREVESLRRPRTAIVIDDMGFDRNNSARALRLPPEVTLAYLPFAPEAAAQVPRARLKRNPVMLHLPMEAPDHGGKPGVNVLSVASSPEKLWRQLTDILGRFGGYTGVNNHMGSKFTRYRAKMDIVISEL